MHRTIEQATLLSAKLKALPHIENERRKISKQEEIKLLASDISTLTQERNWTIHQVAEYLTGEGLEIAAPTLKSYLQRSKSAAGKKTPIKKKAHVSSVMPKSASYKEYRPKAPIQGLSCAATSATHLDKKLDDAQSPSEAPRSDRNHI